ncbi:hypothetical protein MKZ38_009669 [Zalerion maritima]|uniref:Uncharacterized protein n=1 Tax=Zalerion maritima TaxID=339359 RepID=A0AAD5RTY4_9PEZI|nr:hypothetical protein MKZ38_009669 [Zalerion maritima]
MNGGGNMAGGMVGVPTPAGHQTELNYIYNMVEELSRQLAENRRVTEEIVAGLGRVRQRARNGDLGNDELLAGAAEELAAQEPNLDHLISLLSEALEKSRYSRDANQVLLTQYASAMSTMLKQFHEYKAKHVADVSQWHRSYREQLAEARLENARLREQIWEMQEHAGKCNALVREFRRKHDESPAAWERRSDSVARRQELRFWKRMAFKDLVSDEEGLDEGIWSDDDDIVDKVEKERQKEMERKVAEEQLQGMEGEDIMGMGMGGDGGGERGEVGGEGAPLGMGRMLQPGIEGQIPEELAGGQPNARSMMFKDFTLLSGSASGSGGANDGGDGGMLREDGSVLGMPPRPTSAGSTGSSGQ